MDIAFFSHFLAWIFKRNIGWKGDTTDHGIETSMKVIHEVKYDVQQKN